MRTELWLPVPGHPDYAVSSEGRLRRETPGRSTWVGRIILGGRRSDGYRQVVGLPGLNLMHQVVCLAFKGPCPSGYEINHKDWNKQNNKPGNLEYVSHKVNSIHGFDQPGQREALIQRAAYARSCSHAKGYVNQKEALKRARAALKRTGYFKARQTLAAVNERKRNDRNQMGAC